jgi:hypothetical protein
VSSFPTARPDEDEAGVFILSCAWYTLLIVAITWPVSSYDEAGCFVSWEPIRLAKLARHKADENPYLSKRSMLLKEGRHQPPPAAAG